MCNERICVVCGDDRHVAKMIKTETQYKNQLLCSRHYSQIRLKGIITDSSRSMVNRRSKICSICKSTKKCQTFGKTGVMYCSKHYAQMRNNGKILKRTIYDPNEIIIRENHAELLLYNSDCEEVARVFIDIEDVEKVSEIKWHLSTWGYAEGTLKETQKIIMMQRLLINANSKDIVDHKDRDPLNNRKDNLRIANKSKNSINIGIRKHNKSGVTGVHFSNAEQRWIARITYNKKNLTLGRFIDFNDAIKSRLQAESKYFKDFAPQKHLFAEYDIKEEI